MKSDEILATLNKQTPEDRERIRNATREMSSNSGEVSEELAEKIIAEIIKDSNGNPTEALIGTACLLQRGGTSGQAPSTLQYRTSNCTVTIDMIRRHCKNHKATVRQFARAIKTSIYEIMTYLGEDAPEGNLAKIMRLEKGDITREQALWASDFQTYNPNCDEEVKIWLKRNFQNRFRRNK